MSNFFGFRGNNNIDGGNGSNNSGRNDEIREGVNNFKKSIFSKLDNATGVLNNMMGDMRTSNNFNSLMEGAKRFDMSSVRQLVRMYESEENGSKDPLRAFFWARFGAEYKDAECSYKAGADYFNGFGVNKNLRNAWKFFEQSYRLAGYSEAWEAMESIKSMVLPIPTTQNHIQSLRNAPEYNNNTEELINNLLKAKQGDTYASMLAGNAYIVGDGVKKDGLRAYYLYKCAYDDVSNGMHAFASYNMGRLYECGRGVCIDYNTAIRYYDEAAGMGHTVAAKRARVLRQRMQMTPQEYHNYARGTVEISNNLKSCFNHETYYSLCHYGVQKGCVYLTFETGKAYASGRCFDLDYDEAKFYLAVNLLLDSSKNCILLTKLCSVTGESEYLLNYLFGIARKHNMEFFGKYQNFGEYRNSQSLPTGNYDLYKEYIEGFSVPYDWNKACEYLEKAIRDNNVSAFYEKAMNIVCGHYGSKVTIEDAVNELNKTYKMAPQCYDSYLKGLFVAQYNRKNGSTYKYLEAEDLLELLREALSCDQVDYANGLRRCIGFCNIPDADSKADKMIIDYNNRKEQEHLQQEKTQEEDKQNFQMEPEVEPVDTQGVVWTNFETLRRLILENDSVNLCELGDQADEATDYRFAATCYKEAALRGNVFAYIALIDYLYTEKAIPYGFELAERMIDRLLNGKCKLDDEMYEYLSDTKEKLQDDKNYFSTIDLDERRRLSNMYIETAKSVEEEHYSEEEWLLYEIYNASTRIMVTGGLVPKLHDKYYSKRLDWDILINMPWENFLNEINGNSNDFEEQPDYMSNLKKSDIEEGTLPDNLDKYFEGMIGMEKVKEQLDKIYQSVKMQIERNNIMREQGQDIADSGRGYNFLLLGNPGTGKTTVARIIAQILFDIGIRNSDTFVEIERSKVVSDHVGGTETRMREILDNVQGGTLFIDEAYALYREDSSNDFGQEAIDVLMKDMEDRRDSYSVIMAGYKEPMLNMVKNANSGFTSRFSYTIELPDYSDDALIQMAYVNMDKQKFIPSDDVEAAIRKCIAHDKIDKTFGNARYIRELVNRAIENQSQRLANKSEYDKEELFQLTGADFWGEDSESKGVKEYLEELNSLTGLASVKEEINSLVSMITVQKEMEKRGLTVNGNMGTLHMAFKGNPGTGKTTVARIIGKIYTALGVLKRDDVFVECSRADLVAEYQGQTATKVSKVVQSALGGILFIDEAYSLVQNESDTFGHEAVDMLVTEMENNRDSLVVILAGYSSDMDKFFMNNQGLRSRVPKDIIFEDYSLDELYDIAIGMLKSKKYIYDENAEVALRQRLVKGKMESRDFGNARGVRNIIDDVIRKQNVRIANVMMSHPEQVTDEEIVTIKADDII